MRLTPPPPIHMEILKYVDGNRDKNEYPTAKQEGERGNRSICNQLGKKHQQNIPLLLDNRGCTLTQREGPQRRRA